MFVPTQLDCPQRSQAAKNRHHTQFIRLVLFGICCSWLIKWKRYTYCELKSVPFLIFGVQGIALAPTNHSCLRHWVTMGIRRPRSGYWRTPVLLAYYNNYFFNKNNGSRCCLFWFVLVFTWYNVIQSKTSQRLVGYKRKTIKLRKCWGNTFFITK